MPLAQKEKTDSCIILKCACGIDLRMPAEAFGKTTRCPACAGLLRLALAERKVKAEPKARILAKCSTCGQIILEKIELAGKTTSCFACGDKVKVPELILPPPPKKIVKKAPKAIKKKVKQAELEPAVSRTLAKAAVGGKVSLRPGQRICPSCGAVLEVGANICLECETNIVTNKIFEGPGPSADPVGVWRGPNKW